MRRLAGSMTAWWTGLSLSACATAWPLVRLLYGRWWPLAVIVCAARFLVPFAVLVRRAGTRPKSARGRGRSFWRGSGASASCLRPRRPRIPSAFAAAAVTAGSSCCLSRAAEPGSTKDTKDTTEKPCYGCGFVSVVSFVSMVVYTPISSSARSGWRIDIQSAPC
jgi:hypothetical protein